MWIKMKKAYELYQNELSAIREAGTYKDERIIVTPQRSRIDTTLAKGVVNMCANNYLGLSDNPDLIAAAKASYDEWGFGLSSVRFICGTQDIHKQLEARIAKFVGMEDAILYSSCFDANGGLFETLLGPEDAIISDELNHASICPIHSCKYPVLSQTAHPVLCIQYIAEKWYCKETKRYKISFRYVLGRLRGGALCGYTKDAHLDTS